MPAPAANQKTISPHKNRCLRKKITATDHSTAADRRSAREARGPWGGRVRAPQIDAQRCRKTGKRKPGHRAGLRGVGERLDVRHQHDADHAAKPNQKPKHVTHFIILSSIEHVARIYISARIYNMLRSKYSHHKRLYLYVNMIVSDCIGLKDIPIPTNKNPETGQRRG